MAARALCYILLMFRTGGGVFSGPSSGEARDVPAAVRTPATFGLLRTPLDNASRKFQLGAKFNF